MVGFTPFIIIAFDNVLIIALNMVLRKYGGVQTDMLLTCNTILQSFMLVITMPLGGITGGTQTILGFNIGARRPDRIFRAMKEICILCVVFCSTMFLAANFVPELFVSIFTKDAENINLTVKMIQQYTIGVIPLAVQYELVDGLTGMGMTKYSIFCSIFRKVIYIGCVVLIPMFSDIMNVFYAEPISDIVGTTMSVTVFFLFAKKKIKENSHEL